MRPLEIKGRKALNKAYLKVKLGREEIEAFKGHLLTLLDNLAAKGHEGQQKTLVATFLRDAFYKDSHQVNEKDKIDLAIFTGKSVKDPVGVIIEAKSTKNAGEMFGATNLGAKSLCELVLYYLRERVDADNHDLRHMVITNGYDWYIFDTGTFDRLFFNAGIKKEYVKWRDDQKASAKTSFFYDYVSKKVIQDSDEELPFVHLNLRDYEKAARNADAGDDDKLIVLYKLLSPSHLLKEPFANDSNSLNKDFYAELLHIIGLEEAKDKNKKVIRRQEPGKRLEGSLLEHTIERYTENPEVQQGIDRRRYGGTAEEQQFGIGLELCITWVNRILFLKLLEAQLRAYHHGSGDYRFLDPKVLTDFDKLNDLFFQVLAKRPGERTEKRRAVFKNVPYLNSSLFEKTELELGVFGINVFDNGIRLPVHGRTVLRDGNGKRLTGELGTLDYLLRFLEAYDFSAEGGEEIQEENKTLINASVLGLIFEKINGYRDGSFFTPGFITMYMCRETLRRAVVDKFNAAYGWDAADLEALKDRVESHDKSKRAAYNGLVNSLRICDPAVGSGHFLVSALNELLAIKSELGILSYRDGGRVKEYGLVVENDELIVLGYEDGKPFRYLVGKSGKANPELQRLQEALFHEKQVIIENCLFGVDINPNSVKICRLRLWIELLKNAYYTEGSGYLELETLPNIDINIKQGNSLVSRFGLDDDLGAALKESGHSVAEYRAAVDGYRHASGRDEKLAMLQVIDAVKGVFKDTIDKPLQRKIAGTRGQVAVLEQEVANLKQFGQEPSAKVKQDLAKAKAAFEAAVLEKKEIEENALYREAFEWRFEFPEVLGAEGEFGGFDVVIANPPYIRQEEIKAYKGHFERRFKTYVSSADLYVYFVELGMGLLRAGGAFCYIIPNKWMRANYGGPLRGWLVGHSLQGVVDFGDLPVFEEAITYPCILSMAKEPGGGKLLAAEVTTLDFEDLGDAVREAAFEVSVSGLSPGGWTLMRDNKAAVLEKIRSQGVPLGEYVSGKIYYGIKTGLNEAFVVDGATRDRLIAEDERSAEVIKPFLAGRDVKRWRVEDAGHWLILIPNGWTTLNKLDEFEPWGYLCYRYPAVARHLEPFEAAARKRSDQGQYWWELRACDYYGEFEKAKVFYPDISAKANFAYDTSGYYSANTTYFFRIKSDHPLAVLAVLNSAVTTWVYATISTAVRGGYLRFFTQYVETLPILIPTDAPTLNRLESLVSRVMEAKAQDSVAETGEWEAEIDRVVYGLYGLGEEEIGVVEGGSIYY